MKHFYLYIFALISFMQIGCVRDTELSGMAPDNGCEKVAALPVDEALSDLRQQLDAMRNSTRSATFDEETVAILRRSDFGTTRAATEAAGDSLAYIVNFADGGYAILGADPHLPSVIAIVEKGEMTPETLVAAKRSTDSGERIDTPTYIDALVADYILRTSDDPTPVARISGDWVVKEHQPSFIKTKWGQNGIYGKYCVNDKGEMVGAGCVTVAISQILAYNHATFGKGPRSITGMPFDWTNIDQATNYADLDDAPEGVQDYTAKFIYNIGVKLGINYPDGLYTSSNKDVLDFMQSSLMNRIYANSQKVDIPGTRQWNPEYQPVKPEEMPMFEFTENYARPLLYTKKHPIYITGELEYSTERPGHAWVLDGWMRKTRSIFSGGSYIADYAYCNYGWYGSNDGLYAFGVFYKYKYVNSIIIYNLY